MKSEKTGVEKDRQDTGRLIKLLERRRSVRRPTRGGKAEIGNPFAKRGRIRFSNFLSGTAYARYRRRERVEIGTGIEKRQKFG